MDAEKYQNKIIGLINNSLHIQNMHDKIIPIKILRNTDRYFSVECKKDNKTEILIFLRYDEWFFYLHGLKDIPEKNKRKYISKIRGNKNIKTDIIKNKQKEIIRNQIRVADRLLKELKKAGKNG